MFRGDVAGKLENVAGILPKIDFPQQREGQDVLYISIYLLDSLSSLEIASGFGR